MVMACPNEGSSLLFFPSPNFKDKLAIAPFPMERQMLKVIY